MIHYMGSCKEVTVNLKIDGLLVIMLLGQYYRNILGYTFIVVDGEVNMSKVELVIFFL